jgi:chemotaxis family two-component system response regulator Rcp1
MNIETEVLLVDDNPADAELTADLLRGSGPGIHTHCVSDGAQAMAFLHCEGMYSDAPRPNLIMLDLNMPAKDGWAVLVEVKSDIALETIPVLVFSTSQARTDIARCYQLGANCYVTKPTDLDGFKSTVAGISNYWFGIASLVRRGG